MKGRCHFSCYTGHVRGKIYGRISRDIQIVRIENWKCDIRSIRLLNTIPTYIRHNYRDMSREPTSVHLGNHLAVTSKRHYTPDNYMFRCFEEWSLCKASFRSQPQCLKTKQQTRSNLRILFQQQHLSPYFGNVSKASESAYRATKYFVTSIPRRTVPVKNAQYRAAQE